MVYPLPRPESVRAGHPRGWELLMQAPCCPADGIPLQAHARCPTCGILIGPGHPDAPAGPEGLCEGCRGEGYRV